MKDSDNSFSPEGILEQEFQYIAQTAFQANEDRANASNFYLVTAGSLVLALLSVQFESLQSVSVYLTFALLFLILAVIGFITVLQLAKLRLAWFSSIKAMNHLKSFAASHSQVRDLSEAFLWNEDTLPPKYDRKTVGYLMALQVAVFAAASLAAAVVFILLSLSLADRWIWVVGAGFGFIYLLVEMLSYKRRLLT